MKNKIEYYVPDGCLGGYRGLTFDLETSIISKWNGIKEPLSENNIDEVEYCIDMNINRLEYKIEKIEELLNQKETKYTVITGGYSVLEQLKQKQVNTYIFNLNESKKELVWFRNLKVNLLTYIQC